MRSFPPMTRGAAIMILILGGLTAPLASGQTTRQAVHVSALERDLTAIPSGAQPTDAQVGALSADLGQLFQHISLPPTVTLDYAARILADAAAQGRFSEGDLHKVASAVMYILNGGDFFGSADADRLEKLVAILGRAGIEPSKTLSLGDALAALPSAFTADSYLNYVTINLQAASSTARGYRHASSNATLSTQLDGSNRLTRALGLLAYRVPYGKYNVSVTTGSSGQPVQIGTFRVTARDRVPLFDLSSIYVTSAVVGFGDATPKKPLPAGLSFADLTGITVTDDQGVSQFTGSFVNPPFITRERRLHLLATPAAPTAGGTLIATSYHNTQYPSQSFEFVAVGLPVDATLTLSVNGAAAQPVTTGPTGDLYIKTRSAVFSRFPPRVDPVNVLTDTVDLFTAQSFAVSDAGGTVLLSASAAQ